MQFIKAPHNHFSLTQSIPIKPLSHQAISHQILFKPPFPNPFKSNDSLLPPATPARATSAALPITRVVWRKDLTVVIARSSVFILADVGWESAVAVEGGAFGEANGFGFEGGRSGCWETGDDFNETCESEGEEQLDVQLVEAWVERGLKKGLCYLELHFEGGELRGFAAGTVMFFGIREMVKLLKDGCSENLELREYMRFGDSWERTIERGPFYGRREETHDMHTDSQKGRFSLSINSLSMIHSI
jgi:hypothetical protein